METMIGTRNSVNDLHKKIQQHLEELALTTDIARTSAEMTRYLDFCARFHNYSSRNIWLILFAKPDATYVAGFNKWKNMNRYVKKGESGIPILAPLLHKEDLKDENSPIVLNGFRTVHVFDVSQTEGESLPPQPDWKSPEKNAELHERLMQLAESKGVTVSVEPLESDIQGVSLGGKIILSPRAGTKTLIHEICHELMHREKGIVLSRTIKELEAESVAFVVSRHFGLPGLNCPVYLALHGVSIEQMNAHTDRVRITAGEIIRAIDMDSCHS